MSPVVLSPALLSASNVAVKLYTPKMAETEQILRDFGLIIGAGLLLQATTAGPLARRLGLVEES